MNKTAVFVIGVALMLGGCAKSPQQVEVSPRITVSGSLAHVQKPISVRVYDERSGAKIGSRGGVYSETSTLSTGENFALSIRSAVELALRQMGLKVTDSEDTPQFQVMVEQLKYTVPEGFISQVHLQAVVRVSVVNGDQTFTGRYRSDIKQKLVAAPSDQKNVELVNQVLNDALSRAFRDDELKAFLNRSVVAPASH